MVTARIQPDKSYRGMEITLEEVGGLGQKHARPMFHDSLYGCTCLK